MWEVPAAHRPVSGFDRQLVYALYLNSIMLEPSVSKHREVLTHLPMLAPFPTAQVSRTRFERVHIEHESS